MERAELDKIIRIIGTHAEGDGDYCDTGDDMDWACRSYCVKVAIDRLEAWYKKGDLSNCCSAPIVENTDICSECKEHCEGE